MFKLYANRVMHAARHLRIVSRQTEEQQQHGGLYQLAWLFSSVQKKQLTKSCCTIWNVLYIFWLLCDEEGDEFPARLIYYVRTHGGKERKKKKKLNYNLHGSMTWCTVRWERPHDSFFSFPLLLLLVIHSGFFDQFIFFLIFCYLSVLIESNPSASTLSRDVLIVASFNASTQQN